MADAIDGERVGAPRRLIRVEGEGLLLGAFGHVPDLPLGRINRDVPGR